MNFRFPKVPSMNFTWLQNTNYSWVFLLRQHDHLWIFIALTNKCIKYELHLTSECKVIDRCSCCHGNKVSIATRSFMDLIALTNNCTKFELYMTSECKVICNSQINSQLAMWLATRMTSIFPIPSFKCLETRILVSVAISWFRKIA